MTTVEKIFGFKIGGLQQKILVLVVLVFIITVACITGMSAFRTKYLAKIVADTREEQQAAIEAVSMDTIHQVIDSSMVKINSMQAMLADNMFTDIESDVLTLQSIAQGNFLHKDDFEPIEVLPPDPGADGRFSAMALSEADVDYTQSDMIGIAAHMGDTMLAMCEHSDLDNSTCTNQAESLSCCSGRLFRRDCSGRHQLQ